MTQNIKRLSKKSWLHPKYVDIKLKKNSNSVLYNIIKLKKVQNLKLRRKSGLRKKYT